MRTLDLRRSSTACSLLAFWLLLTFATVLVLPAAALEPPPEEITAAADETESEGAEEDASATAEEPLGTVAGEIVIRAGQPSGSLAPASAAVTVLHPTDGAVAPSSLADLGRLAPAVAENGQGGLFQVLSVRGISRQRVLNLIAGVRVTGERRAGVSTSFFDPQLVGTFDLLRGPASSFYGSGALGGILQVFPQQYDGWTVRGGYESQGDENFQMIGWGDPQTGWSLGVVNRQASSAETADAELLPSGFSQMSAVLQKRWQVGERRFEWMVLPAFSEDIGKPNTEFPDRVVVYPTERHLIVRFAMERPDHWSFQGYVHPQSLETLTTEEGSRSLVDNESFDLGATWHGFWNLEKAGISGRYGLEYFGRRGVDAAESITDLSLPGAPVENVESLEGGSEDELGVFTSARWQWGKARFESGLRLTWLQQDNAGAERLRDSSWSAFAGMVLPLRGDAEFVVNAGRGLRFASLSERFFSGTTGRGMVIGNEDLKPESSTSFDLGLRHYGPRSYVGAFVFHNRIDDYIERVEVAPDQLAFVNLVSGTIRGVEVEGFFQLDPRWRLLWGGHLLEGEDSEGEPLADVPVHRLQLGAELRQGRFFWKGRWEYRLSKDDPGSGEKVIPQAHLVDLGIEYRLRPGWSLGLQAANLLDEHYFPSADRRASPGTGRSIGMTVAWSGG